MIFLLPFSVGVVYFLIQYAQMEALEELAEKEPNRVQIIKKAAVTSLIKDGDKVIGVNYTFDGQELKEYGPVVLATGTFALTFADRNSYPSNMRGHAVHACQRRS